MQGTKSALTHSMERDYAVNTKRRVSLGQILEAGYLRWLLKKKWYLIWELGDGSRWGRKELKQTLVLLILKNPRLVMHLPPLLTFPFLFPHFVSSQATDVQTWSHTPQGVSDPCSSLGLFSTQQATALFPTSQSTDHTSRPTWVTAFSQKLPLML